MKDDEKPPLAGPRGGKTTVTPSGLVKKNLWVSREVAVALRLKAFEEHRSEAEIIREAIDRMLGPHHRPVD